ncbi:MAG TPA: YciI family protein [Bacteroidales bacterium]|nr:YciI family protein [Bacteroidales bacterium]
MNFVVTQSLKRNDVSEEMMKPHVNYLKELLDRGKLVVTGPFTDDRRGGMFVLEVNDQAEMKEIVNNDPAFKSGYVESEVRPYKIVFER